MTHPDSVNITYASSATWNQVEVSLVFIIAGIALGVLSHQLEQRRLQFRHAGSTGYAKGAPCPHGFYFGETCTACDDLENLPIRTNREYASQLTRPAKVGSSVICRRCGTPMTFDAEKQRWYCRADGMIYYAKWDFWSI